MVNVQCYKSESRWFNPSWCHWNFSLIYNPSHRQGVRRDFVLGVRGGSTNSVEDTEQRERGSGGGSPLVRGS